ncbi:MAG TPA: hypothetical protein VMV92_16485 [Streptosporangiaceae bacterium]|nr:hypothetical protein [Streptosporangiaceae bacterium]
MDGPAAMLSESGVETIAWFGVRLFTDNWTRPGADDQELEVEPEASRRDPYRLMSRLFHIIGRCGQGS